MGRAIKLVAYYLLYQLLFTGAACVVSIFTNPDLLSDPESIGQNMNVSALALGTVLAGVAMAWHLIHFKYVKFEMQSWYRIPMKERFLSLLFIIAALFIAQIGAEVTDLPNLYEETFVGMSRTVSGFISIAIMAPIVEELLFRGAIQGHFQRQGMRPRNAILLSALIFGIIHFNPGQSLFAFLIGLVFGWLYYRTGSLVPGMVAHFINNSVCAVLMATATPEVLEKTTAELLGTGTLYALTALALVVFAGTCCYLKKHLPAAAPLTETPDPTPKA